MIEHLTIIRALRLYWFEVGSLPLAIKHTAAMIAVDPAQVAAALDKEASAATQKYLVSE